MEVVEWALDEDLKDWTVLWDYGALLALTDCVYKSMMDHGFAYIIDLDEFIVPQVEICFYMAFKTTHNKDESLPQFMKSPQLIFSHKNS